MKNSPRVRYENFELIKTTGNSALDTVFFATVDVYVTTGHLFWKKEIKVGNAEICKKYGGNWFFVDSGEFAIGYEIDKLARSYTAKTGIETND